MKNKNEISELAKSIIESVESNNLISNNFSDIAKDIKKYCEDILNPKRIDNLCLTWGKQVKELIDSIKQQGFLKNQKEINELDFTLQLLSNDKKNLEDNLNKLSTGQQNLNMPDIDHILDIIKPIYDKIKATELRINKLNDDNLNILK